MGRHLTAEDLERAAYERFANKQTWAEIGNLLGCTEKTLWSHRHTPAWEGAKRTAIARIHDEATGVAWGGLVRAAREGDVAAMKEILARLEGPVPHRLQHGQDPHSPPLLPSVEIVRLIESEQDCILRNRHLLPAAGTAAEGGDGLAGEGLAGSLGDPEPEDGPGRGPALPGAAVPHGHPR